MTSIREQFNKAFLDEDRLINQKVYNNVNKFVKTFDSNLDNASLVKPNAQYDSTVLNQTQADVTGFINKVKYQNNLFKNLNILIDQYDQIFQYTSDPDVDKFSDNVDYDGIVAEYNKIIANFIDPKLNPVNREQFKTIFVDVEQPIEILGATSEKYIVELLNLEFKKIQNNEKATDLLVSGPDNEGKKGTSTNNEVVTNYNFYMRSYLLKFINFNGIINFIAESINPSKPTISKTGYVTITHKIIEQEFIKALKRFSTYNNGKFKAIIEYYLLVSKNGEKVVRQKNQPISAPSTPFITPASTPYATPASTPTSKSSSVVNKTKNEHLVDVFGRIKNARENYDKLIILPIANPKFRDNRTLANFKTAVLSTITIFYAECKILNQKIDLSTPAGNDLALQIVQSAEKDLPKNYMPLKKFLMNTRSTDSMRTEFQTLLNQMKHDIDTQYAKSVKEYNQLVKSNQQILPPQPVQPLPQPVQPLPQPVQPLPQPVQPSQKPNSSIPKRDLKTLQDENFKRVKRAEDRLDDLKKSKLLDTKYENNAQLGAFKDEFYYAYKDFLIANEIFLNNIDLHTHEGQDFVRDYDKKVIDHLENTDLLFKSLINNDRATKKLRVDFTTAFNRILYDAYLVWSNSLAIYYQQI